MNQIDFLSNVLRDYCTLHDLEYMSADDLLYESINHGEADCFTQLTSEQEEWLSCYISLWDFVQKNDTNSNLQLETFIPGFHD